MILARPAPGVILNRTTLRPGGSVWTASWERGFWPKADILIAWANVRFRG